MIQWIFERFGLVVFLVIFISQVVRAVLRSRKAKMEHEAQRDDSAESRRVREIQEQIRRQIADRRGGQVPPTISPSWTDESEAPPPSPPRPRPETTQMPEPFGGPLGRMLEELQKRTQPQPVPPPPRLMETHTSAELERQQRLADDLRAVDQARLVTERRAAHTAQEKKTEAESESTLRSVAREELLTDLADAHSLRRAFVLREVLGTPVGLR
jgi:hypothetical protein